MNDLHYYQYAFARPDCHLPKGSLGVDPRFEVELAPVGPIAAVVSRIGLDQFDPARLQGNTPEDIQWLGQLAARHNEIVCQAAEVSTVLPLRMGAIFRSWDSLRAMLTRSAATVADFLDRFSNRQEWGVKLYCGKMRSATMEAHTSPPAPHCSSAARSGQGYLLRKKAELQTRHETRAAVQQTIQTVEQRLTNATEQYCRIRTLPNSMTGRSDEMVYNAAVLIGSSARERWLEAIQRLRQEVEPFGLLLEASGPWPPYHFCPNLEL